MTSNSISSTATSDLRLGSELSPGSELRLGGAPLQLRVNKRARRLRLRLDSRTGGLMLTIPAGVSQRRALKWAAEHEEWAAQAVGSLPDQAALGPASVVTLFGRPHVVDWAPERPRRICVEGDRILAGGPAEGLQSRLLLWLRREALARLAAETAEYAAMIDRKCVRVSVGDPRSRWGSCSSGGAIRYSWRLILAPDFVRRATVAHEVAHLVHMDHGPLFHALVERLFGADPKPARLWLRREGAGLHRIGASRPLP